MFSQAKTPTNKNGFTLIEIMVVIAIIGILAQMILISVSMARSRARDALRKNDLRVISTALEMYYNDHGTYSVNGGGWGGQGVGFIGLNDPTLYNYPRDISGILYDLGYLSKRIVEDPTQPTGFGYMLFTCDDSLVYTPGGVGISSVYALSATLENPTANDIGHSRDVCMGWYTSDPSTYGKNYAISNKS
jgi:prepilin-type N-terminal cleavage/methylation domain-containing protein